MNLYFQYDALDNASGNTIILMCLLKSEELLELRLVLRAHAIYGEDSILE